MYVERHMHHRTSGACTNTKVSMCVECHMPLRTPGACATISNTKVSMHVECPMHHRTSGDCATSANMELSILCLSNVTSRMVQVRPEKGDHHMR